MGQKDVTEKILESYNDVFADIVNVLLFDGDEVIKPDELRDQSPRAAYKADGKVREIERDVAKRWVKGNIRIACIGFENQTAVDKDIVLRVLGYDGAEYRWQLSHEAAGKPRYPVVTLVLYFGEKPWDGPLTLYEAVDVPPRFRPYVPDMKVNLFEIARLTPEKVRMFKSDFRFVADYFVQQRLTGDYRPDGSDIITVTTQSPGGIGGRGPRFSNRRTGFAASEDATQVVASLQVFRPENSAEFSGKPAKTQGVVSAGERFPRRTAQPIG